MYSLPDPEPARVSHNECIFNSGVKVVKAVGAGVLSLSKKVLHAVKLKPKAVIIKRCFIVFMMLPYFVVLNYCISFVTLAD